MSLKNNYKNKDFLNEQYITLKKSTRQIGEEYNVSQSTIMYWLRKFSIDKPTKTKPIYQNKEWLNEQYITLKKSTTQISEECGVSHGIIYYWLRKFKIKIRTISEAMILFKNQTKKEVI